MIKRSSLVWLVVSLGLVFLGAWTANAQTDNAALEWYAVALELVALDNANFPTPVAARALAMVSQAMWDGRALYDNFGGWPTYTSSVDAYRQFRSFSGTDEDVATTVSYAAFRVLSSLFANSQFFQPLLQVFVSQGYDPSYTSYSLDTAAGLGNLAAANVLEYRLNDGSNQDGRISEDNANTPYGNYLQQNIRVNPPQASTGVTDCSSLRSIDHWQPWRLSATSVAQMAVPHWGRVKPFAFASPEIFRTAAPDPLPAVGSTSANLQTFLFAGSTLGDQAKASVQFWGTAPVLTWAVITGRALELSNLTIDDTLFVLYASSNAMMDATIENWGLKQLFDSARPETSIRCLFGNVNVAYWSAPYQGVTTHQLNNFIPYGGISTSPMYPSATATIAGAVSTVLSSIFGPNFIGEDAFFPEGSFLVEPRVTEGPNWVPGVTDVANSGPATVGYAPATNLTISWDTWEAAAQDAATSRIFAGTDTPDSAYDGLAHGISIGSLAVAKASALASAPSRPPFPPFLF